MNARSWILVVLPFAGCFTPGGAGTGEDGSTGGGGSSESSDASSTAGSTSSATTASSTDPTTTLDDGSTSDDAESGTTTSSAMCDEVSEVCSPDPGAGWTAAFALAPGANGCTADFPSQGDVLFGDLEPGAATCECECGSPTGTCSTDLTMTTYGSSICSAPLGTSSVDPGDCIDTGFAGVSIALGEASASCAEGGVTATLPAATWGTSVATCSADAIAAECPEDGATCLPRPADPLGDSLCVAQEGDVLCPDGYPAKTVYYRDFVDDRACPESCSCTETGATCSVDVMRFDSSDTCFDFTPLPTITVSSGDSECVAGNNTAESIELGSITLDSAGSCSAGPAALTGDVVEDQPVTVCCM